MQVITEMESWLQEQETTGYTATMVNRKQGGPAAAQILFSILTVQDSIRGTVLPTLGSAPHISEYNQDTPSRACPEASFPKDSWFWQVDSQTFDHNTHVKFIQVVSFCQNFALTLVEIE